MFKKEDGEAARTECDRLREQLAQAEDQLREYEERFRTVLDQSIDIVYRRNLKLDCYDYISPAIEVVSGFSAAEFSQVKSADLFNYIHPEDHAVVLDRLAQFEQSRHGKPIHGFFEFRLKCKGGGYRWISDSGVLVSDSAGTPLYHVGVARDITDRKRIEEDLLRSNETLEEKVAERTARLRHLANELSLAEQRERKRLSDFLHDDLQQVLVAAKLEVEKLSASPCAAPLAEGFLKMQSLVADALNKTRVVVQEFVTPLLYVVGFVPALHQLAERMERRYGLRVELDAGAVPDSLPDALKVQLFNSVRELLFNVAKHAGTGSACLKVRCVGGQMEIAVADEGRGFDPQAALSQDNTAGAGYGLYSISERIAAQGGQMSVSSAPDCGTCITLRVPISPEAAPRPRGLDETGAQPGPGAAAEGTGGVRVLVADDHDVVRRGIIALLSLEPGLQVVGQAVTGRQALELTGQLMPDVVVMDIRMPDMDGVEATRLIRAVYPRVAVVGVSAFVDEGFRTAMLDAGAYELLDKADAGDFLAQTIRRCAQ